MIGAPPGYVGYEEGGALTEAVRRRPYQVVLFDEIEKAHPDVFNILLQVLDDGRLTDGQGRTVDFSNVVLIMTSNLGAEYLLEGDVEAARPRVMEAVRAAFRPEFLNRLDEVLLFKRLEKADMGAILDIQLASLERLLAPRRITLVLDDAARAALIEAGYDPAFGARPLRRAIQTRLQNPLAEALLAGTVPDGARVAVTHGAQGFALSPSG
jgi:ATP-dependent Clp protease ATP-binding subunit ClpB